MERPVSSRTYIKSRFKYIFKLCDFSQTSIRFLLLPQKTLFRISKGILTSVLFLCLFFCFQKLALSAEYLPYCSGGADWSNYPYKPITTQKYSCLPKRYCSDVKRRTIKINDFDRYDDDGGSHKADDIIFETTSNETSGACGTTGTTTSVVTDGSGNSATKTTTKATIVSGSNTSCRETITAPKKSLVLKEPILFTTNTANCYMKSCIDLTADELRAISRVQYKLSPEELNVLNDDSPEISDVFNFRRFCIPYKYTGVINMLDGTNTNVKYLETNGENDKNAVYCHEFSDINALQYLLKEGDAYDNSGKVLEDVFQCRLHQCPIPDGNSLTCTTNYYIFYDKNSSGIRLRTQAYLNEYEKQILKNTDSANPRRDQYCTRISCDNIKYTTVINCTRSGPNTSCDTYTGLDNDLSKPGVQATLSSDFKYSSIVNSFSGTQSCEFFSTTDQTGTCYKTTDCGIPSKKNDKENYNCEPEKEPNYGVDETLSYFYRPIPAEKSVEKIWVDKTLLDKGAELGNKIYNRDEGFINEPDSEKVEITAIKRLLRGQVDEPLPPDENPPKVFGTWTTYSQRRDNVKNYFKDTISSNNRDNMCADAPSFRRYGYYGNHHKVFFIPIKYWYGEWYDGFWRTTKWFTAPHILPLCDTSSWGIKGTGREYTCGNSGYICNAPRWDSYYIRGTPTYNWKNKEPDINEISVTACLRQKNSGELSVCGDRECRVDCAFGTCATQWCGIDRCVTLSLKDGENCSLQAVGNNDEYKSCAKVVTSSLLANSKLRFRVNRIGKKVYVFLDSTSTGCAWRSLGDIRKKGREREANRDIEDGTYRGRMDEYSLLDDNSLTDNNNDDKIDDKDIFGEELFSVLRCNKPDLPENTEGLDLNNYKDPKCSTLSAYNGKEPDGDNLVEKTGWITWDIVQYIGNNQPTDGENCKIGSMVNCRGFYDKDGVFHDEQQGFTFPLATSPDLFYKYATIENSPDLFLPLLYVYSYRDIHGDDIPLAGANEDNILLDFFEPKLTIEYGITRKLTGLAFNETETTSSTVGGNTITTDFMNDKITTTFKLKKISQLYPEPIAKVCLSQILTNNVEQQIKCLRRDNPKIGNLALKPVDINRTDPYINAYFHKENWSNIATGTEITGLNNEDKFLPFYRDPVLIGDIYKNLYWNSFVYSQNYPIYLEASYCSRIHYSCVEYRKKLLDELDKGINRNVEIVSDLENKVATCEREIEVSCDAMNGNNHLIQRTISGNTYLVRMKENYNTDGGYNQMCVTKGFEKYQTYVTALPSTSLAVGKCNLIEESKNNPECRRSSYYKFCTQRGVDGCMCLDGTNTCDCSDNNSCVMTYDCNNCPGGDCTKLPNECYLPGVNSEKILLDKDNKMTKSCICEEVIDVTGGIRNGFEVRKATPREYGLCVDLRNINFCEAVKYYTKDRVYKDGGEGNKLPYIQTYNYSNIWRTNQKMYGKYYMSDLGHAEFEKSNDCNNLPSEFCLLRNKCYDETTGKSCLNPGKDCSKTSCTEEQRRCKCDLFQPGTCVGFWKNKEDTIPLAKCETEEVNGEFYTMFKLVPNTECERYTCPTIDEDAAVLYSEHNKIDISEISSATSNNKGLFHGFATWNEYKKGSDLTKGNINAGGVIENGHGDDIEERKALNCLQGYGPAGLNHILENYVPNIVSVSARDSILTKEDALVKNMIGYTNPAITDSVFSDYVNKMSYNARNHLPVRYCNQVGDWLAVSDLYTRYRFDLYYTTNSPIHDINNNGYVNIATYNNTALNEANTYGENVQYSEKYCERLYCKAFKDVDIGLLSVEAKQPTPGSELSYSNGGSDNKYYPNIPGQLNYPKDPTNLSDVRTNKVTNNKNTPWRHAGGAKWAETPAPRPKNENYKNVEGLCLETKNFYPYDTKFISVDEPYTGGGIISISSFQEQYNSLFAPENVNVDADLKQNSLKAIGSFATQPTRVCSKWGVWSEIENKCIASCEPLDVFRTDFNDANNDNLVQNHEIKRLFRTPLYRSNYFQTSGNNIKYGDKYTGGAKWGRTKAGTIAIGECDATIGKNHNYASFPASTRRDGIQFLRNGDNTLKNINILEYNGTTRAESIYTNGRPYRVCQSDGTWGPIQDPCVNFMTCQDYTVTNEEMLGIFGSIVGKINETQNIGTLNGGSINYSDVNQSGTIFDIAPTPPVQCNNNKSFISGTISRTCNVKTGEWNNDMTSSCLLKTCGSKYESIGGNVLINVASGLYYAKSSGFIGSITLKNASGTNVNYSGYRYEGSCPSGYTCKNCTNNKYAYECDFDASNNLVWKKAGECVPITCPYSSLSSTSMCSSSSTTNPGCIPSTSIKSTTNNVTFSNGTRYDGTSFTYGTRVELACNNSTGYYENKVGNDMYAECTSSGTWSIYGRCLTPTCSTTPPSATGEVWTNYTSGRCSTGSYTYYCPGAVKRLSCQSNYILDSSASNTCAVDNYGSAYWSKSGSGSCGAPCSPQNFYFYGSAYMNYQECGFGAGCQNYTLKINAGTHSYSTNYNITSSISHGESLTVNDIYLRCIQSSGGGKTGKTNMYGTVTLRCYNGTISADSAENTYISGCREGGC